MSSSEEDYGKHDRTTLHKPSSSSSTSSHVKHSSSNSSGRSSRYSDGPDRYHIPPPSPASSSSDRYSHCEWLDTGSERYNTVDRYLQAASNNVNTGGERFLTERRFGHSPSLSEVHRYDRYSTLPSHGLLHSERYSNYGREANGGYLPPPAPAPSDRYHHPTDRYIPPPAPSNGYDTSVRDRYIPPDRYLFERFQHPTASSVNPGDPYMRRDLGYHHHYRLPHPNYHIHHQTNYYQPHYQRTLPHRTLVNTYQHPVLPSPTRGHLLCCPNPNHFIQPDESSSTGATTSQQQQQQQQQSNNVLTANISGSNLPVLAASLTNGQNLTSFSASVNVNIVHGNSGREQRSREPSSPLLSATRSRTPSSVTSGGGASGRDYVRHGSTPTPPTLPRCSSMSNCESAPDGVCNNHHYPPARRSCSGVLEPTSTISLCCNSRRNVPAVNISVNHTTTIVNHSGGDNQTSGGVAGEPVGAVATPGSITSGCTHAPVCQHTSSTWRASNVSTVQPTTLVDGTNRTNTPSLPDTSSIANQQNFTSCAITHASAQLTDTRRNSGSSHINSPLRNDHLRRRPVTVDQATCTSNESASDKFNRENVSRSYLGIVKSYIKDETATFFGTNVKNENIHQERWLERRKRFWLRMYGPLRDDVTPPKLVTRPRTTSSAQFRNVRDNHCSRPDILPIGRDEAESRRVCVEQPGRQKSTVFQLTLSGIGYVITTLTKHRPRTQLRSSQLSRSLVPSDVPPPVTSTNNTTTADCTNRTPSVTDELFFDRPVQANGEDAVGAAAAGAGAAGSAVVERSVQVEQQPATVNRSLRRSGPSWKRGRESTGTAGPEVGSSRIDSNFLGRAFDNSNRSKYGVGVVGKLFGKRVNKLVRSTDNIKDQLDDLEDYRPYFTCWVTFVQCVVLAATLFAYGFGPVGVDHARRSGLVMVTSMSLQQVEYLEPASFWLGLSASDLIHLGAKYAPCMRRDPRIVKEMAKWREKERDTACCIRNDDSGCVQSSQADCSYLHNNLVRGLEEPTKTISTWKKWSTGDAGPGGRISGPVCGLDPKFCEAPASIAPHEWPDDITKWPICRKTVNPQRYKPKDGRSDKIALAEHMACEVIGHPCCYGTHGACAITTREYCDFVKGHFHEDASLCSQVSCLSDVCGMIPFWSPNKPDQFYRLWTTLFLHAGVIHLCLSITVQYFFMRDLEKMTGPVRIAIIYIGSGVAGNLASSIFIPYRAEVGPAGAHLGLLACLVIEVLNAWPMLKNPDGALFKLICMICVLFLFGFLPWIDNYAHFFGFLFGFFLSYAFMPYISLGFYDRKRKIWLIWVCLFISALTFTGLVVLFYIIPVYNCRMCNMFNCVSLTKDFCNEQNLHFVKNPSFHDV